MVQHWFEELRARGGGGAAPLEPSHPIERQLFGVPAADVVTFVAVPLVIALSAE